MSVLAYSELLRRMLGIEEQALKKPYQILQRHRLTGHRADVLRALARRDRATIGDLLQETGHNRGGGSYITIRRFFEALAADGLLVQHQQGGRTLWRFADDYAAVKRFLLG